MKGRNISKVVMTKLFVDVTIIYNWFSNSNTKVRAINLVDMALLTKRHEAPYSGIRFIRLLNNVKRLQEENP